MSKESELLREAAERRGWKALLSDVDDTASDSSPLWVNGFAYFGQRVAEVSGRKPDEVIQLTRETNDSLYEKLGVHPRKYAVIAKLVAERCECDPELTKVWMKEAVRMIYFRVPPLFAETEGTLSIITEAGLKIGFVTHSPPGRARLMATGWGWDGKYPVFAQPTLEKKDERIWKAAAAALEVEPEEALAVGDNLGGDIRAAKKAGIKDAVWIRPTWKLYAQGEVPPGVAVIDGIGQLVQAMITEFGTSR